MSFNTTALNYLSEHRIGFRKATDVLIVDGLPGCGKTSSMINYINQSNSSDKFIYVTPYLAEIQRVKEACPSKYFKEPTLKNGKGSKRESFNKLLAKGQNIVTTHALFSLIGKSTSKLIEAKKYTLILDEVPNVVEFIKTPNDFDMEIVLQHYAHLDEHNKIIWTAKDYDEDKDGLFTNIKHQCEIGNLYYIKGLNKLILWTFPAEIFKSFAKNFVITYMFEGQIQSAYYKLYGIDYKYVHVERTKNPKNPEDYSPSQFTFVDKIFDEPQEIDYSPFKQLINIYDCKGKMQILNYTGRNGNLLYQTAFSSTWYKKNPEFYPLVKDATYNYFFNVTKSKSADNMWTTYKDYRPKLSGFGCSRGFVSCSARATNEFRNKKNLAYLINIFPNPYITNFFLEQGIELDIDKYALSEFLQWMFRSQIRMGLPINIYIPSYRMKKLLIAWMDNKFNDIGYNFTKEEFGSTYTARKKSMSVKEKILSDFDEEDYTDENYLEWLEANPEQDLFN